MTIFGLYISNYFIGALILFGILAVLLILYMLFSVLNEQDKIFKEIRSGTKNLMDAGDRLNNMYSLAESLIEKIKEARTSIPSQSTYEIDLLSEDLVTRNIKKMENLASEIINLTEILNSTPTDKLPGWVNENAQVVSQLLSEQKIIAPEINKLQKSIDQIILDLKRNNYLTTNNSSAYRDLEQKLETYQGMVMKAREKSRHAESTIAELESEIYRLRANNQSKNLEPNIIVEQLQNELRKVNLEKSTLAQTVESLMGEINRTKIEKEFIEEKFIELS
jgi:chromosome segregation ATPase